jgi:hypothetical protein
LLRKNEHHTDAERREVWNVAKRETLFFPAYALFWLYKKSGLKNWHRRQLTKRNTTFTHHD